jgi:hypothetical protein
VTPVGSSTVAPCETLKVVATVSSVANTCCIDGTGAGFLEVVDPDGVHHTVGSGAAIGLLCDGASFTGSTLSFTFVAASAGPKTFTAHFSGIAHETDVDTPGSADSSLPKTVTVGTCDDGNACTLDGCDSTLVYGPVTGTERLGGCTHSDISCDDGNACTLDGCDPASGCTHSDISCDDGNACTLDGCDPASGCTHSAISCSDNDPCTDDTCDPATGCVFTKNGTCGNAGCTPGFFKNCTSQWPISTTTLVGDVFTIPSCLSGCTKNGKSFAANTLLQALSFQGGNTLCGGAEILLRAAAAAYLNTLRVNYPLTTAQVVADVNTALASCNRATIVAEAGVLDTNNNLGCKDASGNSLPCKGTPPTN